MSPEAIRRSIGRSEHMQERQQMARRNAKPTAPTTVRTASIEIEAGAGEQAALAALQAAYADACNLLVPIVTQSRCWNRYDLHPLAYRKLRATTGLGAQMCCNVLRTVCAAYRALSSNGGVPLERPVPAISFRRASVHFDARTFSMHGDRLTLYTLTGRIAVTLRPGGHQQRLLTWGTPKEAELISRHGKWFFNLVLEREVVYKQTGPVLGVDVGENNLAATSTGKIWGGGQLRFDRDRHLGLRRRTQGNGSKSARQLLHRVSGRERRYMRHVNHRVSKEIVAEAVRIGARAIAMEDLTHIRDRIKAGIRMRSRLHRWAFRELQNLVTYKAAELGIASVFVNPAYTSKTCHQCGRIGRRVRHRFTCDCGYRGHSDVNAALNHAELGEKALAAQAA
jgi:putative transposase